MAPVAAFSVEFTLSLLSFALLARRYVIPWLAAAATERALAPLLWVHAFRYAPLALFAPGQADPRIPADVVATVAYGDLASALLALAALVALDRWTAGARRLVWLFSIVGTADLIIATARAAAGQMFQFYIGWSWYLLTFYVPLLVVSQALIVHQLVRHGQWKEGVA